MESSRASADAAADRVKGTRADVVLSVRRAYLLALRADTIMTVAKATQDSRQVVVDQIPELVKANLKSSLDLSFAQTSLSEAKLLVSSAENDRRAARASLAQMSAGGISTGSSWPIRASPDSSRSPFLSFRPMR